MKLRPVVRMIICASAPLLLLLLGSPVPLPAAADPTYSREVSRILQQHCQQCHRPDDIAPFPLLTYSDARSYGRSIRHAVAERMMPPWKPAPGHGDFKNARVLSDADRQSILDWVDTGMAEGDPADLPPPREFESEWHLGPPDQTIRAPEPYTPVSRPDHPDRYRCFVVRNAVEDRDRWVKAVDVMPGARPIVHHVLLYLTDEPAQLKQLAAMEDEDPEPGYDCWGGPRINPGAGPGLVKALGGILGGWAPGAQPVALGADVGILFPKNSALIIQVHYNLENAGDGEPPSDQTRVALYFHDAPPKLRLLTVPIANTTFQLEPGVIAKEVTAEFSLDLQGQLGIPVPEILVPRFSALLVAPHMHQLGRQIRAEMRPPGADPVSLIQIDDWDFHWQGFYEYQQRVALPYRSKIKLACTFDNPTNRVVGWGESTEDEMCLLYMSFVAEGALGALFGNPQ